MKDSSDKKTLLLAALNLCGIVLSLYSLHHHIVLEYGLQTTPSFCNINATFNCDAVNASRWSKIAGIPIASYGLAFYLLFFVFSLLSRRRNFFSRETAGSVALTLSAGAVLFSLYLFWVSKFIIGTICLICVGLYSINIVLLVVSYRLGRPASFIAQISSGVRAILTWPLLAFGIGRLSASPYKNAACGWLGATMTTALLTLLLPQKVILSTLHVPPLTPPDAAALARETVEQWKAQSEVTITENRSPGAKQDFAKGAVDAPITIVEFSDFECPACRRFYTEIVELIATYGDKIRVVHRNFPIDQTCNPHIPQEAHLNACLAALFTRCAGEQGRFWEAADYIFTLPAIDAGEAPESVGAAITGGGAALGLDTVALEECMGAERQRGRIVEDIDEAIDLGLMSTPSVWINGRAVPHPSKASIIPIIDHILAERSSSTP